MNKNNRVIIIAEAGVNHNGSLELALELVRSAAIAKADYVKFQIFSAKRLVTKSAPKAEYQLNNENTKCYQVDTSQFDMLKSLELHKDSWKKIVDECYNQNIKFLATPFDEESLDFLVNELNVDVLKISSGDLLDSKLLLAASKTKLPIILSTGMATLGEIEKALGVLAFGYSSNSSNPCSSEFEKAWLDTNARKTLAEKVTLLLCTTNYPAQPNEVNLNSILTLHNAFGLKVGFSDHTCGIAVSIAAVALGAVVIEKHFTLSRNLPGPDHKASLEVNELITLVESIRQVELALGSSTKLVSFSELKNRNIVRKSIVAKRSIQKGETFSTSNIDVKRPGNGISSYYYYDLIGQISPKDFKEDDLIELDGFSFKQSL